MHVRFFLLDLDLDLDLRSVDLDLPSSKRTWTRTWTCSLKVDLDLDFTVAGLVTSLLKEQVHMTDHTHTIVDAHRYTYSLAVGSCIEKNKTGKY